MCVIHFASDRGDQLTLTIHGRDAPEATDFWYGNLLRCIAEVGVEAFGGTVSAVIHARDLASFLYEAEHLSQDRDVAEFSSGWVYLRIEARGGEPFEVYGALDDASDKPNTLAFRWRVARASLPPLLEQLEAAVAAFPVIGQWPA